MLDVLLPVHAPEGTYVARIQLPDGGSRPLGTSASKENWLSLTVMRDGLAPGPHVLFLRRQGGDPSEEYAYGIDVEASP